MKTATQFKAALEKAKKEDLTPVHQAVDEAIAIVEKQMEDAIASPTNTNMNPYFGAEMPAKAWYKGNYNAFLHALNTKLALTGWMAEQSHDGAGMYSTFIVKMVPTRTRGEKYPEPMIREGALRR